MRAMKEVLQKARYLDYDKMMTLVDSAFTSVLNSEDSQEAVKAFRERRDPLWKCR